VASDSPIIDIRQNGIGDVVVACWIVHSARAAGHLVRLNPRNQRDVAVLFGVPDDCLTEIEAADWAGTAGVGHQLEYQLAAAGRPESRFDVWAASLNLRGLKPVRPPYVEQPEDGEWAEAQWRTLAEAAAGHRVLLFPDAAWPVRTWPRAYFIDLTSALTNLGYTVAAMAGSQEAVAFMPCHWWGGFTVRQAAAMARRASVVVGNESGPAHLTAALGTTTVAICGPTSPRLVFAHEPLVIAAAIEPSELPCIGCHFSAAAGYRSACDAGGCQGLMRFDPARVVDIVHRAMASCPSNLNVPRDVEGGTQIVAAGADHSHQQPGPAPEITDLSQLEPTEQHT
jgi:hypothetical protein